jgi:hypothetical protein
MDGIRQIFTETFTNRLEVLEQNTKKLDIKIKQTYIILEDTDSIEIN